MVIKNNSQINLNLLIKIVFCCSGIVSAQGFGTPKFDHVVSIVFENTDYQKALKQKNFSQIASQGVLFTNFHAVTHPSQGNYIAMVAGSDFNIKSDKAINLTYNHLGDLLENSGKTWKIYSENYPGNCSLKGTDFSFRYVRKHNPFISFTNMQNDMRRCNEHIVDEKQFKADLGTASLPHYSMFVPNLRNDGHDTGVAYADHWLGVFWEDLMLKIVSIPKTLVIVTFDEGADNSKLKTNHIFTSFYGRDVVKPGVINNNFYNHYDVLKTIEENWNVGNLGQNDVKAQSITDIWAEE